MIAKHIASYILKPEQLYNRVANAIVAATGEKRLLGVSIDLANPKCLMIPDESTENDSFFKTQKGAYDDDDSDSDSEGDNGKKRALLDLHKFFQQKKKGKDYTAFYEKLIMLYVLLCVDLRNQSKLKDGLHQYRNLVQNVSPESLDRVLTYLVDLADRQSNMAQKLAGKIASVVETQQINNDVPETIMLKGMTAEGFKDRADRELVTPWLKFLWESFKQILDLLHKNPKYEKTYHEICARAFQFCRANRRSQEFHKLCETLRAHLASLKKLLNPESRAILSNINWDWTADSVKFNLRTRYIQLQVANDLEMWNEAFRTIKDIQEVVKISKKFLKNDLMEMDKYYENLARIFLKSENYLFHAYCLFKNYILLNEFKPDFSSESQEASWLAEREVKANIVIMAALIVPSSGLASEDSGASSILSVVDQDQILKEHQEMAATLDFQVFPTRENLLQDIENRGILSEASPKYASIFEKLERSFKPLSLPAELKDSIFAVKNHPSLTDYAKLLQQTVVVRVSQQLSRVYKQVDITKVQNILGWTNKNPGVHFSLTTSEYLPDLSYSQVEKIMIEAVVKKLLNVRVDHIKNSLIFGSEFAAGLAVDERLNTFAQKMQKMQNKVQKTTIAKKLDDDRAKFDKKCYANIEAACGDFQRRRDLINKFNQMLLDDIPYNPSIFIIPKQIEVIDPSIEEDRIRAKLEKEREERELMEACVKLLRDVEGLGMLTSSETSKLDSFTRKLQFLASKHEIEYKKEEERLLKLAAGKSEKGPISQEKVERTMKWDTFDSVKNIDSFSLFTANERLDLSFVIKGIKTLRNKKIEDRLVRIRKETYWTYKIERMQYKVFHEETIAENNKAEDEKKKKIRDTYAALQVPEIKAVVEECFFKAEIEQKRAKAFEDKRKELLNQAIAAMNKAADDKRKAELDRLKAAEAALRAEEEAERKRVEAAQRAIELAQPQQQGGGYGSRFVANDESDWTEVKHNEGNWNRANSGNDARNRDDRQGNDGRGGDALRRTESDGFGYRSEGFGNRTGGDSLRRSDSYNDSRGDRYGSDRAPRDAPQGSDRYGSDRYGSDRYGSDRAPRDAPQGGDRYGSDRYGSDRYGSDRAPRDAPQGDSWSRGGPSSNRNDPPPPSNDSWSRGTPKPSSAADSSPSQTAPRWRPSEVPFSNNDKKDPPSPAPISGSSGSGKWRPSSERVDAPPATNDKKDTPPPPSSSGGSGKWVPPSQRK